MDFQRWEIKLESGLLHNHWPPSQINTEMTKGLMKKNHQLEFRNIEGNLFPDRPFKTNMGNMCRQINFWESSINNHLLPHFLTLSKLWYTAYDCLIYKQCFHEANSNQRLLQISMHCQRLENRVFSLSKSEVEHKLMLHWFSAQIFFSAWQCTFLCCAHGKLYFLHIPKQSTQDNCETDGYFSQRFSDLWKVDLWLEGLWFEFRSRLESE